MAPSPADKQKLKDAFNIWAKNYPAPDQPIIGFGPGNAMLSAKELNEAVQKETADGKSMLEALEYGVQREGIDKVVERLTRKPPKP
ncbi:MAG: hypothetical protein KGL10_06245 [Alphaproteobacteria bacterium]|nr:hypothetical protein [Alphaproteobacteria bacterium]MDE2336894.1 hypothetical protein [Alphaproteobacteria bacterium]